MRPSASVRLLQTLSDARLLALAGDGHERAFEAIVRRYRRQLLVYSRRLVSSDARGEDAVQQALLQAWLALQAGVEIRDVKSWLYRIVRNTALNMQRGAAGTEFVPLPPDARSSTADPEAWMAINALLAELAELPPMQRQALLRTSLEGQSHDEVALAMGLSTGAVRGLIYRARATLRSAAEAVLPAPVVSWVLGSARGAGERIADLTTAGGLSAAAAGGGATLAGVGLLLAGGVALPGAHPELSHRADTERSPALVSHRAHAGGPGGAESYAADVIEHERETGPHAARPAARADSKPAGARPNGSLSSTRGGIGTGPLRTSRSGGSGVTGGAGSGSSVQLGRSLGGPSGHGSISASVPVGKPGSRPVSVNASGSAHTGSSEGGAGVSVKVVVPTPGVQAPAVGGAAASIGGGLSGHGVGGQAAQPPPTITVETPTGT